MYSFFLEFSRTKKFWRIRAMSLNMLFNSRRIVYKLIGILRNELDESVLFRELLKVSIFPFFIPLFLSIAFQASAQPFSNLFSASNLPAIDEDTYSTLLAVTTSVSGLFIGLYFAAMTTISSVMYAQVPRDVRQLLARDQFSNIYLRYLAFFTVLGICQLSFKVLGYLSNPIAIIFFVLAAGVASLSFIPLGIRIFSLFDPSVLANTLFKTIKNAYMNVTISGQYMNHIQFQVHEHKKANNAISTLHSVVDLVEGQNQLNGESFVNMAKDVVSCMYAYSKHKSEIPTDSSWYKTIYKTKDWYRANDIETSITNGSLFSLSKIEEKNYEWLEDNLFSVLIRCIEGNLKRNRYNLVIEVLVLISKYINQISYHGDIDLAFSLVNKTTISVQNLLTEKEENVDVLAIADRLSILSESLFLGFSQGNKIRTKENIQEKCNKINYANIRSIYSLSLTTYLLKECEWLFSRINFEIKTEKKVITPEWYILGKMCKAEANHSSKCINYLLNKSKDLYEELIKSSVDRKKMWLASVYITREQEYWTKTEHHIDTMFEHWNQLTNDKRVDDDPWPSLEKGIVLETIKNRKLELIDPINNVVSELLYLDKPDAYPDFLGNFSHQLGEHCIDSIVSNNEKTLQKVFEIFFHCCYRQFEILYPKNDIAYFQFESQSMLALSPLIDLMEISGFAKLCSEYFSNENLSLVVENRWNTYLNKPINPPRIHFLSKIISFSDNTLTSPNRFKYRFDWKLKVNSLLRSLLVDTTSRVFPGEVIVQHSSPLVRVFYPRNLTDSPYDGINIFITNQLIKREDAAGLSFGREYRDLTDAISREVERYRKHMEKK